MYIKNKLQRRESESQNMWLCVCNVISVRAEWTQLLAIIVTVIICVGRTIYVYIYIKRATIIAWDSVYFWTDSRFLVCNDLASRARTWSNHIQLREDSPLAVTHVYRNSYKLNNGTRASVYLDSRWSDLRLISIHILHTRFRTKIFH